MVSSMIISPQPGEDLAADEDFQIQVRVDNLQTGSFTNPDNTYYAAPQQLQGGQVVGHTHVTCQDMGDSLTPNQALDASRFVFFKGINDDGNGNGLLSAAVDGGLPAGFYRCCTMSSASNHQPVLMPVAQRGAQDDCTKFTVGQGNAGNGAGAGSAGNDGGNAGNGNQQDGGDENAGNGGQENAGGAAGGDGNQPEQGGQQGGGQQEGDQQGGQQPGEQPQGEQPQGEQPQNGQPQRRPPQQGRRNRFGNRRRPVSGQSFQRNSTRSWTA